MKLTEITNYLEEKFPPEYAEDFDNIGLLAGHSDKEVTKILLCLDCDKYVVAEAKSLGAELIVSHHPVIFDAIKSMTDKNSQGQMLLSAAESGISLYSAHTNLDSAPGGLTEYICEKLLLTPYEPLGAKVGRMCFAQEGETAGSLCKRIKEQLSATQIFTTANSQREIKTVAICNGGGGGELVNCAIRKHADLYITGDLKHHEIRELFWADDIDYIGVSHHECEFPATELLRTVLHNRFNNAVEVFISKENNNPLQPFNE